VIEPHPPAASSPVRRRTKEMMQPEVFKELIIKSFHPKNLLQYITIPEQQFKNGKLKLWQKNKVLKND